MLRYIRQYDICSSSSETLKCTYCGRIFNTIEDLINHQKSEQQDQIEK